MKWHISVTVITVLCLGLFCSFTALDEQAQAAPAEEKITVLTPLGTPPPIKLKTMAPRLDTLEGKTVCELWDWIFRGDEIFPMIENELAKRYPGIKFVSYDVMGNIHGGEEAKVIAALRDKLTQNKCDAVISGLGC